MHAAEGALEDVIHKLDRCKSDKTAFAVPCQLKMQPALQNIGMTVAHIRREHWHDCRPQSSVFTAEDMSGYRLALGKNQGVVWYMHQSKRMFCKPCRSIKYNTNGICLECMCCMHVSHGDSLMQQA